MSLNVTELRFDTRSKSGMVAAVILSVVIAIFATVAFDLYPPILIYAAI